MSPLKQGWALGPVLEPKGKEALCKTLSGGRPLSLPLRVSWIDQGASEHTVCFWTSHKNLVPSPSACLAFQLLL